MMKKLLVLVLVLGMVSTAGAALSFGISGLNVTVSGGLEQDLYVVVVSDDGSVSMTLNIPPAPSMSGLAGPSSDLAGMGLFPDGYTGEYWALTSGVGETYANGDYLTGSGAEGATVYASWFDEYGGSGFIGSGVLTSVPEPTTMALLGLGGLLLKRRKK
ncbi:MAG: PEP-CTERM sorting domain-containing protein [Phycisphaerae bacterium]|jgi:hypothetical protein